MPERRFSEAEVAAIIERASVVQEGGKPIVSDGAGVTLAQLQQIGQEVGIDPTAIAEAAATIDEVPARTSEGLFGLPLRVERIVNLDRRLSDEEWEHMVVDLRETFSARGVMKGEGSFRQWTNGNLQALLEPTMKGHRVRLRTFKGNVGPRLLTGVAMMVLAAPTVYSLIRMESLGGFGALFQIGFYGIAIEVLGLALIASALMGVRSWAARRREQMEALAARWRG